MTDPAVAPAGWYRDPSGPGWRWWDGAAWTNHVSGNQLPAQTWFAQHQVPAAAPKGTWTPGQGLDDPPPEQTYHPVLDASSRRSLLLETWFVMAAFLLPVVLSALTSLAGHVSGLPVTGRFPVLVGHNQLANLFLGIADYLPVAAVIPVALLLLQRTGQSPRALGLGWPKLQRDIGGGIGLAVLAYGTNVVMLAPFATFIEHHKSVVIATPIGHVPTYYLVWGIAISATTAISEEVMVNGYLLTRLDQLGWSPRWAFVLSLTLRTSYHIYYGWGFLLTVPFGVWVTRSFQKHRRLNRPIWAHFIYDAVLFTISFF